MLFFFNIYCTSKCTLFLPPLYFPPLLNTLKLLSEVQSFESLPPTPPPGGGHLHQVHADVLPVRQRRPSNRHPHPWQPGGGATLQGLVSPPLLQYHLTAGLRTGTTDLHLAGQSAQPHREALLLTQVRLAQAAAPRVFW